MAVNAIAFLREPAVGALSLNGEAFRYLMVPGAQSLALSSGADILDFWQSQLELGFPRFLCYQNLPHLAVVALDRALLGSLDVLTVFDSSTWRRACSSWACRSPSSCRHGGWASRSS